MKKRLEGLAEVAPPVVYVSKEDALAAFKSKHQNDQFTLPTLDETRREPARRYIKHKAKDPSQYGNIASS